MDADDTSLEDLVVGKSVWGQSVGDGVATARRPRARHGLTGIACGVSWVTTLTSNRTRRGTRDGELGIVGHLLGFLQEAECSPG